ncbi:MAG: aspartyl/glutamyl-tRNA amidotransferase subunit A [Pirellulales bacterium]|nr:aspartyl/glutamyl-tRNA amidotransferase subunit A [Pirellulales bacterium]
MTRLNVLELAASVQNHVRTARQVCDASLARAQQFQERFRPFITLTAELAVRQAERVDHLVGQGKRLPLAGVPFGVKDLFDVEGIPTTCGSPAMAGRVATADAECVRRLVSAGAVCLGKLNMHECAFGFTGENPHYGDCRNPWNAQRIAGGSSSGSAVAVALDICPLAIGSDTGGSIRQPAALCGITGLKPSYGRVSRAGGVPLSWTMDHVGPMVHTAEEAAAVLRVLAGHDPQDAACSQRPVPDYVAGLNRPLKGLRLGVPGPWFFDRLDPEVAAAIEAALAQLKALGCQVSDTRLPLTHEALGAHRAIIFAEAASYYQPLVDRHGMEFGESIRALLQAGNFLPAVDYLKAQRVRTQVRAAWKQLFAQFDCLVTPTTPLAATRFGQQTATLAGQDVPLVRAYLDLTLPFNLSGHPAISVPCGFTHDALPIGMQLVGRPFDEGTILAVAHQYQQAVDWHRRARPEE